MAGLLAFLEGLGTGTVALSERPVERADERAAVGAALHGLYRRRCLDLAGDPPGFDEPCARGALVWLAEACWLCLAPEELMPDPWPARVALGAPGETPARHFSADLTLCYAEAAERRAAARDASDPVCVAVRATLRAWPLSGVASGVRDGPTLPLRFGHWGLEYLYAERLLARPRPEWVPGDGPTREAAEVLFAARGLPLPPAPEGSP